MHKRIGSGVGSHTASSQQEGRLSVTRERLATQKTGQIESSEAGQSERGTDEDQPSPKDWSSEFHELRCVNESGELKPLDAQRLTSFADVESHIRLIQEQSDAAIRQLRHRQAELSLEAALDARLQLIEDMEVNLRDRDSQIETLEFALSASEQNRRVTDTETARMHQALEARVATLEEDLEQARQQQAKAARSCIEPEAQVAALVQHAEQAAQRQTEEMRRSKGLQERSMSLESDLERAQKQCEALQCEDLHLATTLAEIERRERDLRGQNAQAMDRLSSRRMSIAVDEALAAQGLSRTQSMDMSSSPIFPSESSDKAKSDNQSCDSFDASSNKTSNQDVGNDKCKICLSQVASCIVVPCRHKVLCASCARQLLAVGPAQCPRCKKDVETFLRDLPSPERSPIYRGWGVAYPS